MGKLFQMSYKLLFVLALIASYASAEPVQDCINSLGSDMKFIDNVVQNVVGKNWEETARNALLLLSEAISTFESCKQLNEANFITWASTHLPTNQLMCVMAAATPIDDIKALIALPADATAAQKGKAVQKLFDDLYYASTQCLPTTDSPKSLKSLIAA